MKHICGHKTPKKFKIFTQVSHCPFSPESPKSGESAEVERREVREFAGKRDR